ncbi:MAG: N-acetyl-alpha-D-glucosaminyl L-malate synthase BshA [Ignavibacteriales bacterium]|jgi:N-acetyl-alpha-D-glucosaminyl L-malate synthase BshA|nr:N-acetyl-alpha-D-glucosaminyl L-malate synthase BshA [Ignavibacteriaceae bacterium]NLH60417.1 N-acetyl-alpha-D-glucosaminyl L-malate synthase BshA [Ignavibacteriales bacterium]HOJ19550.1 N-acetyl-alpha-D-glucosaminyl L-malate synthase BshA [Ignavibacteriaceae bacterium]HPO56925.1 N-acetyl-alpha-D-glucosaminyl L-malate synthase BshA [Ignavibacteriaceae bacterium]
MKIGITCYPTYGGSGVVATELGKELALKGHQVHFISYAMPFRLNHYIKNIFFHEVEISNYPLFEFSLYSLALASKMVEVATYEKLDLLHVHYAIPHATSAYLARQIMAKEKQLKIITTLHGTDITLVGLEPSFLHLVRFSIEESNGVTAVSRYLKEKTITNYHIEKDIEVIPNFIDCNLFRPVDGTSPLKHNIAPNGEKVLVHVSNFRTVKRVQDAIKVFDVVQKSIPSKLVLVGDGPDRGDCERLSRELHLSDKVVFLGKQEALTEILNCSDIFLIPSQSESFGLSALEAMSCGLPVISSSVGGLPELVVHNRTGFIAEIGDIERMAKYVLDLLTNEKKYSVFSQNARSRAVDFFRTDIVIPQYEAYYEKVLGG